MVDEDATTDAGAGVDLDAREVTRDVGEEPRGHEVPAPKHAMRDAMGPQRVEARVRQHDLCDVSGRGVRALNGEDILERVAKKLDETFRVVRRRRGRGQVAHGSRNSGVER